MSADQPNKAYTWDDAMRDLALSSPLSIREAQDVTWPLRETALDPYVTWRYLARLMAATATPSMIGDALAALVTSPVKPEACCDLHCSVCGAPRPSGLDCHLLGVPHDEPTEISTTPG